jgi:hypothetical protein
MFTVEMVFIHIHMSGYILHYSNSIAMLLNPSPHYRVFFDKLIVTQSRSPCYNEIQRIIPVFKKQALGSYP